MHVLSLKQCVSYYAQSEEKRCSKGTVDATDPLFSLHEQNYHAAVKKNKKQTTTT